MDNYSIPKNYRVIEELGLKGIVKVARDGSEKQVAECVYRWCLPAKCYGRIVIATLPAGVDSIKLTNHNGKEACGLPIFNIRFGASCIYIRTQRADNGDAAWCLLNKDFSPVKWLPDFQIIDKTCNNSYYIPINHEYMKVQAADGRIYSVQLATGDSEEIREEEKVKRNTVAEYNPTLYDIEVGTKDNSIVAIPNEGPSVNVTRLLNIYNYIDLFEALLGKEAKKGIVNIQVRGKTEEFAKYTYSNVPVNVAKQFMVLVRRFEYMGDASVTGFLYKYIKATNQENVNILECLNKELSNGFTTVLNEKDGYYGVKSYFFTNRLYVLVRNKNGRLVTCAYDISGNAIGQDSLLVLEQAYALGGLNAAKLEVEDFNTNIINCSKGQTGKLPRPLSVKNRKELNNNIKSSYYDRIVQVDLDNKIKLGNDYGNISFTVAICDGFTYMPKSQRNARTMIAKGRTNNILTMVS